MTHTDSTSKGLWGLLIALFLVTIGVTAITPSGITLVTAGPADNPYTIDSPYFQAK